jgi:hypothetical protein
MLKRQQVKAEHLDDNLYIPLINQTCSPFYLLTVVVLIPSLECEPEPTPPLHADKEKEKEMIAVEINNPL